MPRSSKWNRNVSYANVMVSNLSLQVNGSGPPRGIIFFNIELTLKIWRVRILFVPLQM